MENSVKSGARVRRTNLGRDQCWYEAPGGARCTAHVWGGTLVCRGHMRQGMRRFLVDHMRSAGTPVTEQAVELRLEQALGRLDSADAVRVAEVRDPGRLRF